MKKPMSQEFSFHTRTGVGSAVVTVCYDFDDDVNLIDNISVITDAGVEIDQYLSEDQMGDIDIECYQDLEKQIAEAKANDEYDRGEARYLDRMAA